MSSQKFNFRARNPPIFHAQLTPFPAGFAHKKTVLVEYARHPA
jgi:hypothetical protein